MTLSDSDGEIINELRQKIKDFYKSRSSARFIDGSGVLSCSCKP